MEGYSNVSDAHLLCQLKKDAYAAFDEIYRRHWYGLYEVAYKRLGDVEQCKDIVQDIFTDLWNNRQTKEIQQLTAYLHTAVRYKVYSLLAKGLAGRTFTEPFEQIAGPSFDADTPLQEKELAQLLSTWIEQLPEKRKEIFVLRYVAEKSTREISEELEISQKTVQNQLITATNQLQDYLGKTILLICLLGQS